MDRELRLAALDMDGTLLNSAHETSPRTREALRRVAEAGKVAALCTGRCLSELREHLSANPDIRYVIAENGACLYDAHERRVLRQITLPDAAADRVLEASRSFDVTRQVFIANQSWMEARDGADLTRYHIDDYLGVFRAGSVFVDDVNAKRRELGAGVEKINLYFADASDRERFRPALEGLPVRVSTSIGLGFEISPREADKGSGLRALCALLGIPVEQSMVVGDGGNDLDLMAAAGFAVAMGNAIDEVRALADAITDDCDHDGAALALETWLLGEN